MPAQKSECPVAAGQIADDNTYEPVIVASPGADEKARATLLAAYALAGYAVHTLCDGEFLVVRWNLSKHCPDIRSLSEFARLVGVRT